jgi:hypothetical protein
VVGKYIDDKISDFIVTLFELKRLLMEQGVLGIEKRVSDLHIVTWQVLGRLEDIGAPLQNGRNDLAS